jgi:catechol 2,3-dioxygenase-like lactoylglutathione lyase family enzyme
VVAQLDTLMIDCADPRPVAEFWSAALGYERYEPAGIEDEEAAIRDPSGRGCPLWFQVVPEAKTVKNRVHLDLRPADSMAAEVERMHALGATTFRYVEEHGTSWTVMQDVEGNEFCVLRSRAEGARRSAEGIDSIVFDCADPFAVADFWCDALGFEVAEKGTVGVEIDGPGGPMLSFVTVPEPKTVKNRVHFDLSPPSTMREEVERLTGAGATEIRFVSENQSFWTVMLDPGGNELCVLRGPHDDPPRERTS